MKNSTWVLFKLLRSTLFNEEIDKETQSAAIENAHVIYKAAKHHDVAHLLANAYDKCGFDSLSEDLRKQIKKKHFVSVIRYERIIHDYKEIKSAFEQAKIDFIPLKGSVIRDYYPEPWMRSSCDIDILIKENDLDRAMKVLQKEYSYTSDNHRDFHDISLHSRGGTHLELHFNIMENMKDVDTVLSKVWDYAKASSDDSCMYELSPEFLLYHILAHMSYHILNGGCGIRSFIDLYLLEKQMEYDDKKLCEICSEGGLLAFKKEAEKLAFVWLENNEHDAVSETFEQFVLGGGVYGSHETASAIKHVKNGSKGKYILTRIFQPYDILKEKYPVLKKHKWLLPICHVRRWIYIVTSDRRNLAPGLFKAGGKYSEEQVAEKIEFLKNVGLEDK